MLKRLLVSLLLATACLSLAHAERVQWTAKLLGGARAGEASQIVLTAKVEKDWHMYSSRFKGDFIPVTVTADGKVFVAAGNIVEPPLQVKYDRGFKMDVAIIENETTIALPVTVADSAPAKGKVLIAVRYQVCDSRSCDAPKTVQVPLVYTLEPGSKRADHAAAVTDVPQQPAGYVKPTNTEPTQKSAAGSGATDDTKLKIEEAQKKGLLSFMLLAFVAGLAALATPCVWPMIPITVSFFSKKKEGQSQSNMKGAIAYCLGIIGTFTGIGVVVSLIFGAAGVQMLAANIWVNLALGILFIVLALNLFGVYEIVVPQGLISKAQGKTREAGIIGPLAMGLVFSLTSFTCTVPFAGTVLASANGGNFLYPAMGMLAFSTAFALPFFLLALFPQWLASMPKSGGWLVTVKAYMGFLEIAAALKFLSNADLARTMGLLTREVFLALWVAIFGTAFLYLMGWIKVGHDEGTKVGWPRRIVGLANLVIIVFLLHGLRGGSLGQFTAFLPPAVYPGLAHSTVKERIEWNHDIASGIDKASQGGKLIFINFTGVTCSNCRVMEQDILPNETVAKLIDSMVPVELYTDRESAEDRANAALRDQLTKVSTNPVYVVMTPEKKVLKVFQGLAGSTDEFVKFLNEAKQSGQAVALE